MATEGMTDEQALRIAKEYLQAADEDDGEINIDHLTETLQDSDDELTARNVDLIIQMVKRHAGKFRIALTYRAKRRSHGQ